MDIQCPKCGSHDLHAAKQGFSGKKAVIGGLLTGGVGLLAGTIGSNKVKITCLKCGHVFAPGDVQKEIENAPNPVKPKVVPSPQTTSSSGTSSTWWFIIVLLVIIVFVGFLILFSNLPTNP